VNLANLVVIDTDLWARPEENVADTRVLPTYVGGKLVWGAQHETMSDRLHLRILRPEDLSFADSLRALVGWNQTLDDWRRFLAMEPEGCFLAEWDGVPAGTITTLRHSSQLAWIGMVLVHPEHRRRGIGRALFHHCLRWLQERGVCCIKLDATPAGKQLYEGMGFKDEWTLTRWEHAGLTLAKPLNACPRPWRTSDAQLVSLLDAAAFGVSRQTLLEVLAGQSRSAFLLETPPGPTAGYGFIRPGSQAAYLGPIVATSAQAGLQLVEALLGASTGGKVFWDIPDANTAAVVWARRHGFTRQRMLTRMYLGQNTAPSNPWQQFALAGPEVG
jgi:GNAT superfamily N-acetyltransferase